MNETGRSPYHLGQFFTTGLRNAHAMEVQAVQILSRQVERSEDYPDLEAMLRRHLAESEQQRLRLAEVLENLGETSSALKDMTMGAVGNVMAMAHIPAGDEVIKDTLANYAFEHYEIATYKTLITVGEAIGAGAAVTAARISLAEEERMAAWISDHLGSTVLQFMALAEGERAPRETKVP